MKEIEDLCKALKHGGYKSKQAVFNHYIDDFCNAKDRYGWGNVVEFINKETGITLNIETYRSMFKRAKKKAAIKNEVPVMERKKLGQVVADSQITKTNKTTSPPDGIDFNSYLNVCFNNKIIAQDAINNGVSIETIKSWGCANFVQVSTALGNHIRNKRK